LWLSYSPWRPQSIFERWSGAPADVVEDVTSERTGLEAERFIQRVLDEAPPTTKPTTTPPRSTPSPTGRWAHVGTTVGLVAAM